MADDTPDTPPADAAPAPTPRRRGPNKAPKADAAPKQTPAKRTPAKRAPASRAPKDTGFVEKATDTLQRAEDGALNAVKATRGAATRTAKKAEDAVVDTTRKAGAAVGVVKPRSSKRAAPRTAAKSTRKGAPKSAPARSGTRIGGWRAAAITGGLAAAGAAAAALFTLRSSTPKPDANTPPKGKGAHQPDGTDASKSFEAGIADENTVPNS